MRFNTPFPNAFTINKFGFSGRCFPLGLSCCRMPLGVYSINYHTLRVMDICDLLRPYGTLAVLSVEGTSWSDSHHTLRLGEFVERTNIESNALDADLIVIPANNLRQLLSGIDHYNLSMFDVPKDHPEKMILSNAEKEKAQESQGLWDDELLAELSGAKIYLQSHDDCYLHLQSYDLEFPKDVFKRALQIYVGTVLRQKTRGEIEEIPKNVIDALWPENSGIKIERGNTTLEKQILKIGVATMEYAFQYALGEEEQHPTSIVVEYDYANGRWYFHKSDSD